MFDIIGKRYYFFALSLLIMLAGLVGYFVNGIQLDIQFQGGTIVQMQMNDENFNPDRAAEIVQQQLGKKATAQKTKTINAKEEGKNLHLLSLSIGSEQALTEQELNKVVDAIRKEYNIANNQMDVQNVQPLIGKELRNNGIKAIIVTSILTVLYIWWRFKIISGLSAGVFALVALLHDVAVIFVVYLIFKFPLNESFIAAVLTILGYSINDTIVIYDRIRENSRLMKKVPLRELVNTSIIQSVSRSINTMICVLLSISAIYIFASIYNIQSMKEFSMPLLVGLASGAYSTIFIVCPLWVMWKESQARRAVKPVKA